MGGTGLGFKLITRMGTAFDRILGILTFLASIVLVSVTLLVVFDVITRYFLSLPQTWVSYTAAYSMVFITFMSTAWVLKREGHVKMDLVLSRLRPRPRALLNIVLFLLSAVVWLVVTWYSAWLAWGFFQSGEVIAGVYDVPKAPVVAPIPVGSLLLSIECLRRAYRFWRSLKSL